MGAAAGAALVSTAPAAAAASAAAVASAGAAASAGAGAAGLWPLLIILGLNADEKPRPESSKAGIQSIIEMPEVEPQKTAHALQKRYDEEVQIQKADQSAFLGHLSSEAQAGIALVLFGVAALVVLAQRLLTRGGSYTQPLLAASRTATRLL